MRIDRKILANPSKATTARSVYVAASSLSILATLERTKSQAESAEYAKDIVKGTSVRLSSAPLYLQQQ